MSPDWIQSRPKTRGRGTSKGGARCTPQWRGWHAPCGAGPRAPEGSDDARCGAAGGGRVGEGQQPQEGSRKRGGKAGQARTRWVRNTPTAATRGTRVLSLRGRGGGLTG